MLTLKELTKVTEWINKNFVGTYYISFASGFRNEAYVIIETERDCREGRQVFSVREILGEE